MIGIADQVRELSGWLEGTDIELLELEVGNSVIRLRRGTPGQSAASPASVEIGPASFEVCAPSVGVFRRAHPLQTNPLVEPGQKVTAGDIVALLQIGALLVHVIAPKDGTILEALVNDGAAVGYGTALVRFSGSGE